MYLLEIPLNYPQVSEKFESLSKHVILSYLQPQLHPHIHVLGRVVMAGWEYMYYKSLEFKVIL